MWGKMRLTDELTEERLTVRENSVLGTHRTSGTTGVWDRVTDRLSSSNKLLTYLYTYLPTSYISRVFISTEQDHISKSSPSGGEPVKMRK